LNQLKVAMNIYQLGLNEKKPLSRVYLKLGVTLKALGENAEAEKFLKKGLAIEPKNEELLNQLNALLNVSVQ
jgi:tetratricopeptide (TPR) repeat protein